MPKSKVSGVYAIVTPGRGRYVGSSVDIRRRWSQHRNELRRGVHGNFLLQRAYAKHAGALVFTLLEECPPEYLHAVEQYYMNTLRGQLLNLQPRAGAGGATGYVPTEAARAAMGAAQRGRKHSEASKELRRQAARGRKHSEATRAKISAAKAGGTVTLEQRRKLVRSARPGRSGLKGVIPNRSGWQAQLKVGAKLRYLGTYKSPALAYWTRFVYIECMGVQP